MLGLAIERVGKVERVVIPDIFVALVYAVVGQLISAKAVASIWNRMQEQLGEITPGNLANQSVDEIRKCGLTLNKATCIHSLAQSICQGALFLDELKVLPYEEVIRRLVALNGIGRWTAEMVLIHSLERSNVVSFGDAAIRRGMQKLYGQSSLTKEEFDRYCANYSPYGSVAPIYLWEISFE